MPGSRLYNFTLKQPQFEITPFQAVAFEPKEQPNIGLLTNAFEKIEQRENNTSKAKADLNAMFSVIDSKLNKDDKETMDWWNKFQQQRLDAINDYIRGGDYSKAFQFATEAAGEAANNKELLARQYRYETYKKEDDKQRSRADSGDIRYATYDLYKQEHPFDYEFIKDDDGNIISSKAWSAPVPVKDFDIVKHYATAFQLINPDTDSKGTSSSVGRTNGAKGIHTSNKSGSSRSVSRTSIKPAEVLNMIKTVFDINHDDIKALGQRYRVDCNELEKLEAEFDKMDADERASNRGKDLEFEIELRKKLLWHNGGYCGERLYYARLIAGMYNAGFKAEDGFTEEDFPVEQIAKGLGFVKSSVDISTTSDKSYIDSRDDGTGSGGGSTPGTGNIFGIGINNQGIINNNNNERAPNTKQSVTVKKTDSKSKDAGSFFK